MTTENKEYVSFMVSKDVAKQLRDLQSCDNEQRMVEEVAAKLSLNIEQELLQLDDDLARYKAACIVFKNSLKTVYHEQQEEIDKVIDNWSDIMPKVKQESTKMITEIERDLSPLRSQIDETAKSIESIKTKFNNINFYGAERMIELVDKISTLDKGGKDILKFLMNEYKIEK